MELFIEKEFLDDFYLDYHDTSAQKNVKNIISQYGDKKVYVNYELNDYEKLKQENNFFALICNTTVPIPVINIKEAVEKSTFSQTLVFARNDEDWFKQIEAKGALCFSFENYEKRINSIIKNLHFKIDLSEEFKSWGFLNKMILLNFNKIIVTDNYILTDKDYQKMEKNIIPILQRYMSEVSSLINVTFFTKNLNPIDNKAKYIKEKAKKRLSLLNRILDNYKKDFKIVSTSFDKRFGIDLHDRTIATNFSLLDSGKGFNLIPHKISNSQIVSETIFDKYTYIRFNNIFRIQKEYKKKIERLESSEFKQYP